jgi:hypothetical protein
MASHSSNTTELFFIDRIYAFMYLDTKAHLILYSAVLCLSLVLCGCKSGTTGRINAVGASVDAKRTDGSDKDRNSDTKTEFEVKQKLNSERSEDHVTSEKSNTSTQLSDKTTGVSSSGRKPDHQRSTPDSPPQDKSGKALSPWKKISEADLIKKASLDIAKGIETVTKIKICYVKNQDEWWVTLYDDLGPIIDMKQYVWDRDTETLRPFLVLKRISKNRLDSDINSLAADRICEVMDPPRKPAKKKD